MSFDTAKFHIAQTVYRKLQPEKPGMVTGIVFRESYVEYLACFADQDGERTYQAIELTSEKAFNFEGDELTR